MKDSKSSQNFGKRTLRDSWMLLHTEVVNQVYNDHPKQNEGKFLMNLTIILDT